MSLILRQLVGFVALFSVGCFSPSEPQVEPDGLPAPETSAEPAPEPKDAPEPKLTPSIDKLYVIAKQDQGFKIYAPDLAKQQTVILDTQAHFATLQSNGVEELTFETNFVEKSEIESENYLKEHRPFGHFQVDAKVGERWAIATPGHIEISSIKQMTFNAIQPDTSDGLLKTIEATLNGQGLTMRKAEKVLQFEESHIIQFDFKSMWFVNDQFVFEVLADYGPGEIYPKVTFKQGGVTYYAGEYLIKRRIDNVAIAVQGKQMALVSIECGQCSG